MKREILKQDKSGNLDRYVGLTKEVKMKNYQDASKNIYNYY